MPQIRFTELVSTHAATGCSAGDWRAIGVSFGAALIILSAVSFALQDRTDGDPVAPCAIVRESGGGDSGLDAVTARLLSLEQITSACCESHFPAADARADAALADIVEQVRANLRVDVDPGTRDQKACAKIRWIGDPSTPGAAALVNQLAHDFASIERAEHVAAAERTLHAVATRVREAAHAVRSAEREFESALDRTGKVEHGETSSERAITETHAGAPEGLSPSTKSTWRAQLQSQLEELESQRSMLAERLMPAHPEMRELDTQITSLRAKLAGTASFESPTDAALPAPPAREAHRDLAQRESSVYREWEAVLNARRQYEIAVGEERATWERFRLSRTGEPIEIVPASLSRPAVSDMRWWKSAVAALAAWLAGWLVLVFWSAPTAPLTTPEQVRRATRLPVIAVPSLN